jgi:hypothetical protein
MKLNWFQKSLNPSGTLAATIFFISACGGLGSGSIKAPANLELSVTDSNYNTISLLGSNTLSLDTEQPALWLKFEQPGSPTGYALIVAPKYFDGENVEFKITPKAGIQSKDNSTTTIGSSFYNVYFDLVLRGHRALVAGDLEVAKNTIAELQEKYSETYGGLTLEILVAIAEGNTEKILDMHRKIKRVYPDSIIAKSLDGETAQ